MSKDRRKRPGFYWHVYHDVLIKWCNNYDGHCDLLIEWCDDYSKRPLTEKPSDERALRLKLFQPVRGKLPSSLIKAQQVHDKAWQVWRKACQVYDETWQVYRIAGQVGGKAVRACDEAGWAWDKAQQACTKAIQAYDEAGLAYDKTLESYSKMIEELHGKECPDCPWDGKTMFPGTEK